MRPVVHPVMQAFECADHRHGRPATVGLVHLVVDRCAVEALLEAGDLLVAAGDVDAQNILGVHYYLGLGVPRDFARAAALFEQAALANHADAQRNLAIMYMNGYGVPQDNQRAYGWFFQSHSGGNLRARSYIKYLADNVTPNAGQKARLWVEEQIRAHLQGGAARAGDTPGS